MTQPVTVDLDEKSANRASRSSLATSQLADDGGFCSLVAAILRCRRCSLLVADSAGSLTFVDSVGFPPGVATQAHRALGDSVAEQVARTGEPWISNCSSETRLLPSPIGTYSSESFISFPFSIGVGYTGIINATERELDQPFGPNDIELLHRLSAFYAETIHHESLHSNSHLSVDHRQCRKNEIQILEEERRRIAKDLHDDAGHRITAAILRLNIAAEKCNLVAPVDEEIKAVRLLLRDCIDGINDVAFGLRPQILADLGLVPAIKCLARRAQTASDTRVSVISGDALFRIDESIELAAYRVAQEALTNSLKYSCASEVEITILQTSLQVILSVTDNGVGFDPSSFDCRERPRSGITGIQERVELVGGRVSVQTSPGYGTTITAEFQVSEVRS